MPTPKGRLVAKDFVQFFLQNSARLDTLLSSDPHKPELWELLFERRFKELPEADQAESWRVKRGSTDQRWEQFLHEEKALRIVSNLRAVWQRRGN